MRVPIRRALRSDCVIDSEVHSAVRRRCAWHFAAGVGAVVLALCLAACESTPPSEARPASSQGDSTWQRFVLPTKRETHYVHRTIDGRPVIQADADNSVSLYRRWMRIEPVNLGRLSFSWMVPKLIAAADLSLQSAEDAPVRVVLAFEGDRSKLSIKNRMLFDLMEAVIGEEPPYATLMYVWDNRAPIESVIKAGRTDRIRKIVVDSGPAHTSVWRFHERDIVDDYRRAFGEEPGPLISVALMTDSDNTHTAVRAYYGELKFTGPESAVR
ncbi:MAG: DUF3047 domain-containing protein [Rhizobacter sp.]